MSTTALSSVKRITASALFALLAVIGDRLIMDPFIDSEEGPTPAHHLLPGGTGSLHGDVVFYPTTDVMILMGLVAAVLVATGRWRVWRSVLFGLVLYVLWLTGSVLMLLGTTKGWPN